MLLPVVKALIFCARPQDEGLKLAPYNYFLSVYGWAIGFIYYKSIVIIVVALKVHLLISDSDHEFAIIFVVLLLSGIKSI